MFLIVSNMNLSRNISVIMILEYLLLCSVLFHCGDVEDLEPALGLVLLFLSPLPFPIGLSVCSVEYIRPPSLHKACLPQCM